MHCYQPRFHIVQADDMYSVRWSVFQTFTFSETTFTSVTAYQNTKVSLAAVTGTAGHYPLFYMFKINYFSPR